MYKVKKKDQPTHCVHASQYTLWNQTGLRCRKLINWLPVVVIVAPIFRIESLRNNFKNRKMEVIDEIYPFEISPNQEFYPCFICDKQKFAQYDLEVHFAISHGNSLEEANVSDTNSVTNHSCSVCGLQFTSLESMNQHLNSAHQYDNYKCGQCAATYVSYDHLVFHFKESHNKEVEGLEAEVNGDKHICLVCGHQCSSSVILGWHVSKRHGNGNYDCFKCSGTYSTYEFLKRHFESKHLRQNVVTKAVSKNSGEKSQVKKTGKAKTFTTYTCKFCNKTFSHWAQRNNQSMIIGIKIY